jgi:hypothetical protein
VHFDQNKLNTNKKALLNQTKFTQQIKTLKSSDKGKLTPKIRPIGTPWWHQSRPQGANWPTGICSPARLYAHGKGALVFVAKSCFVWNFFAY